MGLSSRCYSVEVPAYYRCHSSVVIFIWKMEAPASICIVIHMGKELSSHVESRCYVVQLSLWPCLSTSPLVLWKSERNLSRKRKIRLCKIHFYLFIYFILCMHSCRRRQSPHWAGIRITAVVWNHQQPACCEAPWMALLGSLEPACPTCQAIQCPQRHHKVCVITEWGKTPYAWVLGFGPCAVQPYLMKLL